MSSLDHEVLVCYDVSEGKARARLYEALKDVGLTPVQESVFWGRIRPAEERAILREFRSLLNAKTDRAFIAPVQLEGDCALLTFGSLQDTFKRPPATTIL